MLIACLLDCLNHNTRKVSELRVAREKAKGRGKPEGAKELERLGRNEKKLDESRLEYAKKHETNKRMNEQASNRPLG